MLNRLNKQAIIPNVLMDNQEELNITDAELVFILKIFNMDTNVISDSDLGKPNLHSFKKIRNSLKKKNLINFEQSGVGYIYDISNLEKKLSTI